MILLNAHTTGPQGAVNHLWDLWPHPQTYPKTHTAKATRVLYHTFPITSLIFNIPSQYSGSARFEVNLIPWGFDSQGSV